MFEIKLFTFNKKPNSTKTPNLNSGAIFDCNMVTPSSIINPVIEIALGNTDSGYSKMMPSYNYAYIKDFKRFYFIKDAVWDLGIWTFTLAVDVMGSYRNDILSSTQYILRSASHYNPYLLDNSYPTYRHSDDIYARTNYANNVVRYSNTTGNWVSASNVFNTDIKSGAILIGVVGDNTAGVTYYIMPTATFKEFIGKAFNIRPADLDDVSEDLAKILYNAVQYITVCRWYPIMPLGTNVDSAVVQTIYLGNQTVTFNNVDNFCYKIDTTCVEQFRFTLRVPKHPQVRDTGLKYLNYSPYTELNLFFNPFGSIPIDTTKIVDSDRITVKWYVDYPSGVASLEVLDGNTEGLIYKDVAEYGVALPISSMVYDWKAGLIMSGATLINQNNNYDQARKDAGVSVGDIISVFVPSFKNTAKTLVKGVGDTIEGFTNALSALSPFKDTSKQTGILGSTLGQLSTKGAQGSFLTFLEEKPYLYAWFTLITEPQPSIIGGPCFEKFKISALNGYTVVDAPTIDFIDKKPSFDEQTSIYIIMSAGFYVE